MEKSFTIFAKTKKIMDFTDGFEFYRINLCPDINANVECLRKFIKEYNCKKEKKDEQTQRQARD